MKRSENFPFFLQDGPLLEHFHTGFRRKSQAFDETNTFWSKTGVRYWGQNVILRHMTSWHVNCTHIYVNGYVIITGHCVIITGNDMLSSQTWHLSWTQFMCSKGMGHTTAQVLSRREQMLVWSMFRRGHDDPVDCVIITRWPIYYHARGR